MSPFFVEKTWFSTYINNIVIILDFLKSFDENCLLLIEKSTVLVLV